MNNKRDQRNESSDSEKMVYCGLGVYVILYFCRELIKYAIPIAGLLISFYGIMDIINKSDFRGDMDFQKYIDNMNK